MFLVSARVFLSYKHPVLPNFMASRLTQKHLLPGLLLVDACLFGKQVVLCILWSFAHEGMQKFLASESSKSGSKAAFPRILNTGMTPYQGPLPTTSGSYSLWYPLECRTSSSPVKTCSEHTTGCFKHVLACYKQVCLPSGSSLHIGLMLSAKSSNMCTKAISTSSVFFF